MSNKNLNPQLGGEQKLSYSGIESQIKFLQGKVLTIVDASIPAGAQCKAIKDLINHQFSEQLTWILEICAPNTRFTTEDKLRAEGQDVDAIKRGAIC